MLIKPLVATTARCKCCNADAELFGVCDLNKNCEERNGLFLPLAGVPVYYYRCGVCGFVFTEFMDAASEADFARLIYNEAYIQVDPDYVETRPQFLANLIANTFKDFKASISILDFGGGSGRLASNLRERGFGPVEVYDPFTPAFARKPAGTFNLILCFEVFEHVTDPRQLSAAIASLLDCARGFVVFSTVLQPDDIGELGTGWWYISPRNGHLGVHSPTSLRLILEQQGLKLVSLDASIHFAFREIPDFAGPIFNKA